MKKLILAVIVLSIAFVSCSKDEIVEPKPNPPKPPVNVTYGKVSEFIWNAMNENYLWQDKIDALQLEKGSKAQKDYLAKYGKDYKKLFESLTYRVKRGDMPTVDKWSMIFEDYTKLEALFSGATLSFGMGTQTVFVPTGKGGSIISSLVTYVMPNSPAEKSGIKRGNIITGIKKEKEIYPIVGGVDRLAEINPTMQFYLGDFVKKGGKSEFVIRKTPITITATSNAVNPILVSKALNIEGKKIGYMAFSNFIGSDKVRLALNESIGKLKSQGVTEMVLDLRYNPGGDLYTCTALASMLKSGLTGNVFTKLQYNAKRQAQVKKEKGEQAFNRLFIDKITKNGNEKEVLASINSLNINRLYVLTSHNSASASELIINGLKPYMEVVLVGSRNTAGKYAGMEVIKDLGSDGKTINPNHKWALLPITLKVLNANGVTDYKNGFAPNYKVSDFTTFENIKQLGDVKEPMLAKALELITGKVIVARKDRSEFSSTTTIKIVKENRDTSLPIIVK